MAKKLVTIDTDYEKGTVIFSLASGYNRGFSVSDFNTEIQTHLATYGLKQKIADKYSDSGSQPDPDAYIRQMIDLAYDQLMAGEWRTRRESTKKLDLAEAFFRLAQEHGKELSLEDCLTRVRKWSDKELRSNAKLPAVVKKLAEIEMERAEAMEDSDISDDIISELFE